MCMGVNLNYLTKCKLLCGKFKYFAAQKFMHCCVYYFNKNIFQKIFIHISFNIRKVDLVNFFAFSAICEN